MPRTPVRYRSKSSTEDKAAVAMGCGMFIVWAGAILVSIGFWAVLIWAIIRLVNHFL